MPSSLALPFLLVPCWLATAAAAPLPPELIGPEDDAVLANPVRFELRVEDDEGGQLDLTVHARPQADDAEPFTFVALPDTQFYTGSMYAEPLDPFGDQAAWIAAQAAERNLAFVSHLGDIVQTWDDQDQWARADAAMSLLDGVVPYAFGIGNHDIPTHAEGGGDGWFDSWFPPERYADEPWWGGTRSEGSGFDSYQLFSAGGLDWIVLHLAYEPDEDQLAWASELLDAHAHRRAMLVTHSYLDAEGELYAHGSYDAATVHDTLVQPHDNLRLVLSGHHPGQARRREEIDGRVVHQLLSCFHSVPGLNGGDGYLRIMSFEPRRGLLRVESYSPYLDAWRTDEESAFTLDLELLPSEVVTRLDIPSGETVQLQLDDLEPVGAWEWYAVVSDDSGVVAFSELRSFELEASDPPEDSAAPPEDSEPPPEDTAPTPGDSESPGEDEPEPGCTGCATGGSPTALWPLLALLGLRRRRA